MNKKYKIESKNAIALAVVCMLLLTSIVETGAYQAATSTNKRNSVPVEPLDLGTTNGVLATAGDKREAGAPEFKPGELLVKFKTASVSSVSDVIEGLNAEILNHFEMVDVYHIGLPESLAIAEALGLLRNNAQVEYAEPNYVRKASSTFPNDPNFSSQWALYNTGQEGGTPGAHINAPGAWDVKTGSNATVVAVIDTGVDYNHPDLAGNMWRNLGEIPGNGVDDDGNGYIDDVYGIDAYNHDSNPLDDFGHGTHCAGIVGARGNNSVGVAGVNWNVSIMALKFLDSWGYGYDSGAIECINYAMMMKTLHGVNVRVLSNSWGGADYGQALYDAIQTAGANNILFVASAGNNYGSNNDLIPTYPASYDLLNIIAVAATDHYDDLAYFSNIGPTSVDVGAPGDHVLSTMPTYHVTLNDYGCAMNYDYLSGTSMACPHVSGLAALLLALNPSYTYTELRTRILSTVETLLSLTGKVLMGGRINAWSALTTTDVSMHLNTIEPAADFAMYGGVPYNVTAWVHNVTDPILAASVQASFSTGELNITLRDDGVAPDRFANDGIYTAYWTPSVAGSVTIGVSASAGGYAPASRSVSGRVRSIPIYTITETAYQWVELSGQVVGLCLGWNFLTVTSPFPISFYGDLYTNLTVGSTGSINLEDKYLGWMNYPIPSANGYSVDRLIGVLWSDLNMRTDIDHGTVLCGTVGTSPNRTLVVEWKDVAYYYDTGSVTFEVLFYENSSDIVLQYQDVSFEYSYCDYGADATVGIQYNPEWGTQYSYDTPSLHDSLALRLSSVQTLPLQILVPAIMNDPAQTVYYVRTGNIYDDSALGFVYSKSAQAQNIIPQWNPTYINQTSGRPLFSGDIVTFGGKYASIVTKYYEDQLLAKVWCDVNSTYYTFKRVDTNQPIYSVAISTYNPSTKDYFVIQTFMDGTRTVLSQWGISAQGTYASGPCFADLVWPHIADFGGSYYVYCWEDLNSDGIQTANEISLKASGT